MSDTDPTPFEQPAADPPPAGPPPVDPPPAGPPSAGPPPAEPTTVQPSVPPPPPDSPIPPQAIKPASRKPPILSILLILVVAGLVAAMGIVVGSSRRQLQKMKSTLIERELQVAEISTTNRGLMNRLDNAAAERKAADERMKALRVNLDGRQAELDRAQNEIVSLQVRFERIEADKGTLEARIFALSGERDQQIERAERLAQEKVQMNRSLARMKERLNFMERDYEQLTAKITELESARSTADAFATIPLVVPQTARPSPFAGQPQGGEVASRDAEPAEERGGDVRQTTIELPPIVVRKTPPDLAHADEPAERDQLRVREAETGDQLRGRLVEVNEPHQFAVVNKGAADGVRVGMTFDIIREPGKVIAQVTAVHVRPQLAACDIVRTDPTEPLQIGDVAVQSRL